MEVLRIAWKALRAHKLRAGLTVVSITIGAFSIVFMTSLANSGLMTLAKDIDDLGGARLLLITPKMPEREAKRAAIAPGYLTRDDRRVLLSALPYLEEKTWMTNDYDKEINADSGRDAVTDLVAGDTGFLPFFRMTMAAGRAFTDDENERRAKVCVLGPDLARELFAEPGDDDKSAYARAVDRRVLVAGVSCRVVGVTAKLERVGMNFGFSWTRFALLPLDTLIGNNPALQMGIYLNVKTTDVSRNDIVKRIAAAIMKERHHGVDDFEIYDFSSILARFEQVFLILKLIVGLVASISLVVGGVGVMNMMFVSVTERVREIGIRKALGASPNAITGQFLVEAVVLSSVGGVLGVSLGVAVAVGVNVLIATVQTNWVGSIATGAVVLALLVSALVGVGFGYGPARRAARLDVVDALRR
jgi:putative ABC transport system permease protein